MTSEEMRRMIREVGEGAARTFDRNFVDACTYAVDPGGPELTATAIRAQMEAVEEHMRYARESHHSLYKAGLLDPPSQTVDEIKQLRQQMIDRAAIRFLQGPVLRLKKPDPEPLTFTALQETVLPDLYGKKQHAQLLAAAKKREADEAARLREETNNKIGGLLRGFLGARREEEL